MLFLLINLMVLALVAAAGVFAYAHVLQASEADEWMVPAPTTDYGALQAYWRDLAPARDWESLQVQVRRWQPAGAPGADAVDCSEVARNLNEAVFRFAVPAQGMAPGRTALDASPRPAVHCPARVRGRARS